MRKANLNQRTIKMLNSILESGMTIKELSKRLGFSEKWLYNALRNINHTTVSKIQSKQYTEHANKKLKDKLIDLNIAIKG